MGSLPVGLADLKRRPLCSWSPLLLIVASVVVWRAAGTELPDLGASLVLLLAEVLAVLGVVLTGARRRFRAPGERTGWARRLGRHALKGGVLLVLGLFALFMAHAFLWATVHNERFSQPFLSAVIGWPLVAASGFALRISARAFGVRNARWSRRRRVSQANPS